MSVEFVFDHPKSGARRAETKENLFKVRKRILKYLVQNYLKEEGYFQSANIFEREASLTNEYKICDNVDLDIILQDYCSYYMLKFNKQPSLCKKVEIMDQTTKTTLALTQKKSLPKKPITLLTKEVEIDPFVITPIIKNCDLTPTESYPLERKSISAYLEKLSTEKKQIAEQVYMDVVKLQTGVKWSNIFGLDEAKMLLSESVLYPLRFPQLFTGLLTPWKGILLHGPPGTGKTMLAQALADESKCTFFNVSLGTVVSKYRGESEKIISVLFEMAEYYSPSIIFIDEIESLMSTRDNSNEHEASRRLKSQILIELDGIIKKADNIFLLASSNLPWDIDPAMLRRLEKRIYIDLPDSATRSLMFKSYLASYNLDLDRNINFNNLSKLTEGYSGCDIRLVCKESAMGSVRRIILTDGGKPKQKYNLVQADIENAVTKTRPISKNLTLKHIEWQKEMGST